MAEGVESIGEEKKVQCQTIPVVLENGELGVKVITQTSPGARTELVLTNEQALHMSQGLVKAYLEARTLAAYAEAKGKSTQQAHQEAQQ